MVSFIVFISVIVVSSGQFTVQRSKTVNGNDIVGSKTIDNNNCYMSINETSSKYLRHDIELYKPNFVKLRLVFRYVHERYSATTNGSNTSSDDHDSIKPYLLEPTTSFTEDAIRPYQWVWTYYSPDSFFPYLKWPTDFSLASFGLLGTKTLQNEMFLVVEIHSFDCFITIGQKNTTDKLSEALRDLTRDYLIDNNTHHQYDYTYWCHLSVVPGVKETTRYQFGIYLGYPVDFVRYNCCRTEVPKIGNTSLQINCSNTTLISDMWEVTLVPYMIGILATAFFPLLVFSFCAKLKINNFKLRKDFVSEIEDWDLCRDETDDWIFLEGSPPLCFTHFMAGFFGLRDSYPVIVSRIWRTLVVLCGPLIVYIQLYLYTKHQYQTTLDMIDHGCPLGYLSMLAGFEKSRRIFMPILGGPYCLLMCYYFAGVLFIITPRHLDRIIHDGCNKHLFTREFSPLVYSLTTIEYNSNVTISDVMCGYKRTLVLMKTMFYLIFNPKFWVNVCKQQCKRMQMIYDVRNTTIYKIIVLVFVLPVYVSMCVLELVLTIVYYGIPFVNVICIAITGYFTWISRSFRSSQRHDENVCNQVMKFVFMFAIACLFLYYIISMFTLLSLSFTFLGKIIVFCFLAVVVYPSSTFGYLFFGIALVYYIFKMISGFGDLYLELLADAIEVSLQMENGMYSNQVIDDVLLIDDSMPSGVTKIQIRNQIINLSSIQQQTVHDAIREPVRPKTVQKNHTYGIPLDLFNIIVRKHRPVYIEVAHALLKICVILMLIMGTVSVVTMRGQSEGISELMHVIFIIAVGALPRVLEVAMDGVNHSVKRDIQLRELRTTVNRYWCSLYNKVSPHK